MRNYNIPIFVPHMGCTHNCVFCNQNRITDSSDNVSYDSVKKIVNEYLNSFKESGHIEIAFFGGSFTGIDRQLQFSLLGAANEFLKKGLVDGIRLSTRPDYISENILIYLKEFGVTTIELGIQSLSEDVLRKSQRGYTKDIVEKSVKLIKSFSCFKLGLQMMTGLPGDSFEKSFKTAKSICELKPDFVRIYPTLVIKDTELSDMYERGEYIPPDLSYTVELCASLKRLFINNSIQVIRVGLQTTSEINPNASVLAGPFHNAIGELVDSRIYYDILCEILSNYDGYFVKIIVPKGDISKVIGHKKLNYKKIYDKYNIRIECVESELIDKYTLEILR